MKFRRVRAVTRKEIKHILRDPRSLIMALAEPMLMLVLFGYALTLDVDRIPTVIYDQDHTSQSRELIQKFASSRFFQIVGYANEYKSIESGIDRNKIFLAVVIPPQFGQHIAGDQSAPVQILIDGSDSNTASIALGYVNAVTRTYSLNLRNQGQNVHAGFQTAVPVDSQVRVWYNATLESKNYVVPGLIAVILMMISALLTSLTIAREWEMGTMEQLLSTPLRPAELVLGKMSAYFIVGVLDTIISVVVGIYIFQVPFRGSLLLLAVTSFVFLFGALCWGILLSAITKQQLLAYQLGIVTSFLPSFLLSGFLYAIDNMPVPIQVITHFVPARYFVTILKGIFLRGVGLEVVWVDFTFLIAFSLLVFFAATAKLKQKLA
jgi:ABC-2 type transport system permease protein